MYMCRTGAETSGHMDSACSVCRLLGRVQQDNLLCKTPHTTNLTGTIVLHNNHCLAMTSQQQRCSWYFWALLGKHCTCTPLTALLTDLTWTGLRPRVRSCMPTVVLISCSMGCPSRKAAAVMSMFSVSPVWHGLKDWLYPIHTCTTSLC